MLAVLPLGPRAGTVAGIALANPQFGKGK